MRNLKRSTRVFSVIFAIAFSAALGLRADDLSSTYQWKPVRIGGGGWVTGMVLHPLSAAVRYARTDVGEADRWDEPTQQWIPMRVRNADGTGIQSAGDTSSPSGFGVETIAVDPTNKSIVYIVFPTSHSCDVQCAVVPVVRTVFYDF